MADQLAPPSGALDTSKSYTAIFKTEKGDITVALFADRAPLTVENFVNLARAGFYDGTTFHRVVADFVIQGGDPAGDGWHMLVTARANEGAPDGRGVVGHATSDDLVTWRVRPPLSAPSGFGHLEVPQIAVVDGQPLLLFCSNLAAGGRGPGDHRVWTVAGSRTTGPWDVASAAPFPHPQLYAPRLLPGPDGGFWAGSFEMFVAVAITSPGRRASYAAAMSSWGM